MRKTKNEKRERRYRHVKEGYEDWKRKRGASVE
jgi:hypothetical protein